MRVLHAVEGSLNRPRAVGARRALALSQLQPELGFEPLLWASSGQPVPASGPRPASVVCHRPPLARWPRVAVWSESLERYMRSTRAQVLHAHGTIVLGAAARLAAWRLDKPVVFELYGGAPRLPWGVPCPWNAMVARWPEHARWMQERLHTAPIVLPHGAPREAAGLKGLDARQGTVQLGGEAGPGPRPLRFVGRPRAFARAAAGAELVIFGRSFDGAPPEVVSALALCPAVVAPRGGGFGEQGVRDLYEPGEPHQLLSAIERAMARPAGPRPELLRTRRWRLTAESYYEVYESCLAPEPWTRRLLGRAEEWLRKQL